MSWLIDTYGKIITATQRGQTIAHHDCADGVCFTKKHGQEACLYVALSPGLRTCIFTAFSASTSRKGLVSIVGACAKLQRNVWCQDI